MTKAEILQGLKDLSMDELKDVSSAAWDIIKSKRSYDATLKILDFSVGDKVRLNSKDADDYGDGVIKKLKRVKAVVLFEKNPVPYNVPISMLDKK